MGAVQVTFAVVYAERTGKFYAGCVRCGRILCEGEFAIVKSLYERHVMVGEFPRQQCCGGEVNVPFLFHSKDEALAKVDEIIRCIQTDPRTFDAFSYFPVDSFYPQEIH